MHMVHINFTISYQDEESYYKSCMLNMKRIYNKTIKTLLLIVTNN